MTNPGQHPTPGVLHSADGTITHIATAPGTGNDGDVIITADQALVWDGEGWNSMPIAEGRAILAQRTTDE